jgi:hypothetical protein
MTEFADAIQDETIEQSTGATEHHDTYEELLDEALTDEDKATKRERLETVDREIIRLEEEKKAAAKVSNNKIKPLVAERESLLQALDSGTEKRHVECYEHFIEDGAGNIIRVEVRRVDTDAVVEERAPTAAEQEDAANDRQGDLFNGDSNPPPADLTDPADPDPEDFEPTPEALAQAAEDEGRVVKTTAKEARAKAKRRKGAAEGADAE